jgi:hypothetical protein
MYRHRGDRTGSPVRPSSRRGGRTRTEGSPTMPRCSSSRTGRRPGRSAPSQPLGIRRGYRRRSSRIASAGHPRHATNREMGSNGGRSAPSTRGRYVSSCESRKATSICPGSTHDERRRRCVSRATRGSGGREAAAVQISPLVRLKRTVLSRLAGEFRPQARLAAEEPANIRSPRVEVDRVRRLVRRPRGKPR